MARHVGWAAAGLVAWAAFSWPALAEESPISFVSGPFAGAAARDLEHKDIPLQGGRAQDDSAVFSAGAYVGRVLWSRSTLNYYRVDTGAIERLTAVVEKAFSVGGSRIVDGGQTSANGYLARYRLLEVAGATPKSCAVYVLMRQPNTIYGYVCGPSGKAVPLDATMEGLSIKGVIGP